MKKPYNTNYIGNEKGKKKKKRGKGGKKKKGTTPIINISTLPSDRRERVLKSMNKCLEVLQLIFHESQSYVQWRVFVVA